MSEKIFFSIIVPVFQVEDYLESCINSILMSIEDDCEVILVVGNSKDRSNEIALEFSKKIKSIKMVYQNAKGLSNARNCGFDRSLGEYIIYIDSDDYVNSAMFREHLQHIREMNVKHDVYMTDFMLQKGNLFKEVKQIEPGFHQGTDYILHILEAKRGFWNVWRFIYKKKFLLEKNITFEEGRISEDVLYTIEVITNNPNIEYVHCPYYFYKMWRDGALTSTGNIKRIEDTVFMLKKSMDIMRNNSNLSFASGVMEQLSFEYFYLMPVIWELKNEDRKQAIHQFETSRNIFNMSDSARLNMLNFALKIFGVRLVSLVLYLVKRIRRLVL